LSASDNNFARGEDKEGDLRLFHPIDKAWEQLGLIGAEIVVISTCHFLQLEGSTDVPIGHDVPHLKVVNL
jgi:hypothetical protein